MDMQTWRLRPMVTHSGSPFVHVGVVPVEHIERIAEALRAAGASAHQERDSRSG